MNFLSFSLSLLPLWILVPLIVSHKSFNLFSFLFVLFFLLLLCLWVYWSFLPPDTVYWIPLFNFSVHLQYPLALVFLLTTLTNISITLLKLSLCSCIALLNMVNIFVTFIWKSLSDKCFIKIGSGDLSCSFICNIFPFTSFPLMLCVVFCTVDKTATSSDLERLVLSWS